MLLPEAEGAEAEEAEAEEAEAEEAEEVFFFADLPGGGGQLPTGTQGGRPAQTEACASSFNETEQFWETSSPLVGSATCNIRPSGGAWRV